MWGRPSCCRSQPRRSVSLIIASPDSSPFTPRKWEHHQTPMLATSCGIGSLSSGYLTWPRSSGTGSSSSSLALRYWKANQAPLGSQTPVSESSLTQPPSHITLTALRAKSLGTDTCRSAVDYLAFCADLCRRPPDPPAPIRPAAGTCRTAPSLISRSGMFRGKQGKHQSSTAFASSPDSAGSYRQWSKAIVAMTSTDELRSDPNSVNQPRLEETKERNTSCHANVPKSISRNPPQEADAACGTTDLRSPGQQ